jgi:hypothetical protein
MSEKDLKQAERILGETDEAIEAEESDKQMQPDSFTPPRLASRPCCRSGDPFVDESVGMDTTSGVLQFGKLICERRLSLAISPSCEQQWPALV